MWTLKRDGSLTQDPIEGEVLEFVHVHNGVPFSQAAKRRAEDPNATLIAKGPLIPDQARLAFQVGFDAILIEDSAIQRHGEDAWRGALDASLSSTYVYTSARPNPGAQGGGAPLWSRRHAS